MRNLLQVQPLFKCRKQLVETSRLDHRPRDDIQFTAVETRDEIAVLFLLYDLLKLERKPTNALTLLSRMNYTKLLLASYLGRVGLNNILRETSDDA